MAIKPKAKETRQKPLTLNDLVNYNQKILFPMLKSQFVSQSDFNDFKNDTTNNFDSVLKKLDTLLDEKKVREFQEEKHKKS